MNGFPLNRQKHQEPVRKALKWLGKVFKPLVKPLEKFTLPLEGLEKLLKALVLFNPIIYHLLPLLLSNAKVSVFGFV